MSKSREQIEVDVLLAFLVYVKVLYSESNVNLIESILNQFMKDRFKYRKEDKNA